MKILKREIEALCFKKISVIKQNQEQKRREAMKNKKHISQAKSIHAKIMSIPQNLRDNLNINKSFDIILSRIIDLSLTEKRYSLEQIESEIVILASQSENMRDLMKKLGI